MSSISNFFSNITTTFLRGRKKSTVIANFNQRQQQESAYDAVERGTTVVSMDRIIGSVGRYHDFDNQFKAHRPHGERSQRLQGILHTMQDGHSLPPIALYQIRDDFYILDGHHRFQAAQELGYKEIRAKIIELLPSGNSIEAILYREKSEFRDKYQLPETIELTELGQFARLDWQIAEHQKFLAQENHTESQSDSDAALDWYNTIYRPLRLLIEKSGILESFPTRTVDDLYLYISSRQWQEGKKRKYGITFDKLIPPDMETFRMNMYERTNQDYPEMKREITVFMLLNVEGKYEDEVLRKMQELAEIREIHTVHGTFDLLIKIQLMRDLLSSDAELISHFTQETIRQWQGVISTHTLIPGMSIIK